MEKEIKYLGILSIILTVIGLINSIFILKQGMISLTSILYLSLIVVSIIAILLVDNNLKIASILLLVSGVVVGLVKLFAGTSTGFGVLGALTAALAGAIGLNKEKPFISLGILAAMISIVGWIDSVIILQKGLITYTANLYVILIVIALVCVYYSRNLEKTTVPAAILLCTGLTVFIAKLFIGMTVGIGVLGAVTAIVAGASGLNKNNPVFFLAISAAIIAIFGFIHALITGTFVMGMLSFAFGALIFIIAGVYSFKNMRIYSIVLIVIAAVLILSRLLTAVTTKSPGTWVNFIASFLGLIAGAIGLTKE